MTTQRTNSPPIARTRTLPSRPPSTDPAAEAAWREREHARLRRCETLVAQLHSEGELATTWKLDTAARLLWATTSQRVWEDLVIDQGWSTSRYRAHLTTVLEAALLAPRRHR